MKKRGNVTSSASPSNVSSRLATASIVHESKGQQLDHISYHFILGQYVSTAAPDKRKRGRHMDSSNSPHLLTAMKSIRVSHGQ